MRLFGFELTRATKANTPQNLQSAASSGGGFWPVIRESFTGAWQRNEEIRVETALGYSAVYACITLIAADISKMNLRLMAKGGNGVKTETTSPAFSPVLANPNRYQNRIKFIQQWLISKLGQGNAYILKERDNRNVVVALYVLDPYKTTPLVAPDGSIFYRLSKDNLTGIEEDSVVVPASEIIHDAMVPLYHPLCGVSPITACGMAVAQGMNIQRHTARFFRNGANPGGILTAPGHVDEENAKRLKALWEENFSGENVGRVAILGDALEYKAMSVNAVDAQLVETLKWTDEKVASVYHVPAYMIGAGVAPKYDNIEALNQQYYSQCLQSLIYELQLCLTEGLGLHTANTQEDLGVYFDLNDLLKMDTATQVEVLKNLTGAGIISPNEARAEIDRLPTEGGDHPFMQEQNWPLRLLDARQLPSDRPPTAPVPLPPPVKSIVVDDEEEALAAEKVVRFFERAFAHA